MRPLKSPVLRPQQEGLWWYVSLASLTLLTLLIVWTLLAAATTRAQINPFASDAGEGDGIESASSNDYSSHVGVCLASSEQHCLASSSLHVT